MNASVKKLLVLIRVALGWVFFYAGITKVIDPTWSAAGYLQNASTFPEFFGWLASPMNIAWVNILNEWGLTLIGFGLMLGIWVRAASVAGGVLTVLYWLPRLEFPIAGGNALLVDQHIIYILLFALFAVTADKGLWTVASEFTRKKKGARSRSRT